MKPLMDDTMEDTELGAEGGTDDESVPSDEPLRGSPSTSGSDTADATAAVSEKYTCHRTFVESY